MPLPSTSRTIVHRLPGSQVKQVREVSVSPKVIDSVIDSPAGREALSSSQPHCTPSVPQAISRIAEARRPRSPKSLRVCAYRHGYDPPVFPLF